MWVCYRAYFEDGTVSRTILFNKTASAYSSIVDFPKGAVAIAFSFRTYDDCDYSFELIRMKSWKNAFDTLSEKMNENAGVPDMFTSINDLELVANLTTNNSARNQDFNMDLDAGYYYEVVSSVPDGYSITHNYRDGSVTPINPIFKISKPLTRFRLYVSPSAVAGINVKLYKLSNSQASYFLNNVSTLNSDPIYINEFERVVRTNKLDEKPYSTTRLSSNVLYLHGKFKVTLTSYETFNLAIQVFNLNTMEKTFDSSWQQAAIERIIYDDECVVILLRKSGNSTIYPSDVPENLVMISHYLYYKDYRPYSEYERFLIDSEINSGTSKPGNEMLKRLRNDAPCYDHLYVNGNNPIIPHESLYHLRLSKKMGFKVIEANVMSTSDGVFVVNHFNSGAFGNYFKHVDGVTDISNTLVSDVTWNWIVQNVRYNTTTVKYQTRPSRLEEFLEECNAHDMIPFVASGVTPLGVYSWEIAEKIMGINNYIAYGGTRDIVGDAPIFTWDMQSSSVEAILTKCQQIGAPLIWGSTLSRFEDDVVEEIINTLHEYGFFVGASYADANWDKYRKMGADFNGTQSLINRITNGNIGDNHSSFNWNEFTITGNPTNNNNILTFGSNGSIVPVIPSGTYNYSGYDLEITFNGTITVTDASGSTTKTHDDMATWQVAKPVYTASPSVTISVSAGTTIFDVHYAASKF